MLKKVAPFAAAILLTACGGSGPGTEKWCAAKKEEPKSQWTMDDAKIYAQKCVIDGTAIGSDEWCAKMKEKGKDDLTVEEAADYAKHCVI